MKIEGRTSSWKAATDSRHFCPFCGSSVFGVVEGASEVEVRLGVLEPVPTGLTPTYELWVGRREKWLAPVPGAAQYEGNRP